MGVERIGQVIYRVHDMDAAEAFYRGVIGLKPKFRDGDEWAAFDGGSATFSLEQHPGERAGDDGGRVVAAFRVNGLHEFARSISERDGSPSPVGVGLHESRFSIVDPSGNRVVFYEPATKQASGQ